MTTPHTPREVTHDDNGLAVASLVLGILSVTGLSILTGIPAIITGAMGLKNPVNKGMSIAGIIMGAVSVLFALLAIVLFVILIALGAFAASSYDEPGYEPDYSEPSEPGFYQQRT